MILLSKETIKEYYGISGIYHLKIKNRTYIGSSTSIGHRLKHHQWSLQEHRHHNRTMQNLYNKYQEIYFTVLEQCKPDILIEREKFYMDDLKPCINHILDPVSLRRDAVFKERLSQAMKKRIENGWSPVNKRLVHMYNMEGAFIKSFNSITDAGKYLNIKDISGIAVACKGKRLHSYYNYRWSFDKVEQLGPIPNNWETTAVDQYDLNDNYIKTFNSIKEIGIPNIPRAIKYNRTAGGYKWKHSRVRLKSCELLETPEEDNQQPS
jgi:hypothetical protein